MRPTLRFKRSVSAESQSSQTWRERECQYHEEDQDEEANCLLNAHRLTQLSQIPKLAGDLTRELIIVQPNVNKVRQ